MKNRETRKMYYQNHSDKEKDIKYYAENREKMNEINKKNQKNLVI